MKKANEIEKALILLKPYAEKFTPKQDINYFDYYKDKDGVLISADYYGGENYCEDCVGKAKEELSKRENLPKDFAEFVPMVESSPEKEGFCYCEICGEIIEAGYLPNEQTIYYWLNQHDWELDLKKDHKHCYMLYIVLECYRYYNQDDSLYIDIKKYKKLADKVIKAFNL